MFIGYMGDVIFSTAASRLLTPRDFEREGSSRWNEHTLILRKPVSEFSGAGLEKISFAMTLSTDFGVNVENTLKRLRRMRDTGAVFPLIIGGKPVSQSYWRLDSIKEGEEFFNADGTLLQLTVNVSLTEYEDGNQVEENAITFGAAIT